MPKPKQIKLVLNECILTYVLSVSSLLMTYFVMYGSDRHKIKICIQYVYYRI